MPFTDILNVRAQKVLVDTTDYAVKNGITPLQADVIRDAINVVDTVMGATGSQLNVQRPGQTVLQILNTEIAAVHPSLSGVGAIQFRIRIVQLWAKMKGA